MKYNELGGTGLQVSEIGFGAWAIGGNKFGNSYGPTDDAVSIKAVDKALDLGCNFFDTADIYGHGHSEDLLGKAIKGRRDKVIIATKVGGDFYHGEQVEHNYQPGYVRFALEESLKRLQTEYVDLYQFHNPPFPAIQHGSIFGVMEELKSEGKIRHYGISIFHPQEGIEAMNKSNIETIQVVYNVFTQDTIKMLKEAMGGKDIGIIAREPLANGYLSGRYDKETQFEEGDMRRMMPEHYRDTLLFAISKLAFLKKGEDRSLVQSALRFVLDDPHVPVVIPGAKTPEQVAHNMAAADMPPLSDIEMKKLQKLFESRFEDVPGEN
jgi:aryl-alcohol dehydrogenase-like predicted oxidoreductase